MEDFTTLKCKEIYNNQPFEIIKKNKYVNDLSPVISYINQYFYKIDDGSIIMIKNKNIESFKKRELKNKYFILLNKQIENWFFNENSRIYTLICEKDNNNVIVNNKNMTINLYNNFSCYDKYGVYNSRMYKNYFKNHYNISIDNKFLTLLYNEFDYNNHLQ
jgi:hypothetical protein